MILDLGLIDYEECYRIQKDLVRKRRLGEIEDSLIIAEHNEVFTIGRVGDENNVLVPNDMLFAGSLKVLRVDRGGDVTFHGPGQIVAYPVISLKDPARDLHSYLRDLEEAAIRFLGDYAVCAERIKGKTGVWVSGRKIASVGIGASNWVTFHGLSVNVNCDLSFFSMINPCGMDDVEMASLARIKGQPIKMDEAKRRLLTHLKDILGLDENRTIDREAVLA
ncbi:MAG: lipoyl(octanoyl) transferase LipB [Candidatus Omnitrophica bacterium]|nr:lipoyl(octanoyl) transferase LipB [Candidatus Omnitrophota bacterium]